MKLNELHDNPGAARKKRKRVARGPGSGKGKTAGRGIKGQKSRSGVAINAYEGGQMPLYMRLPKRGFTKPNRKAFAVINLGLLQKFVDAGKLDATAEITEDALVASGLVRRKLDGVRLLAKGELTAKLTLRVTGASKAAVEAVEKAGGAITLTAPGQAGGRALNEACGRPRRRLKSGWHFAPPAPGNGSGGAVLEGPHGIGSGTDGRQPQLEHLRQGQGAAEPHPLRHRPADRLPHRHLHPGPRHRRRPAGAVLRAGEPGHRRHAQHVHRRRGRAHGDLRARDHALHLRLDHRAADDLDGARACRR